MAGMLEKVDKQRKKKARITYNDGEVIICRPLQYLEEDYDSYLVEVLEQSPNFPAGQLLEVAEKEIKTVEAVAD